jgi:hypothetical protein
LYTLQSFLEDAVRDVMVGEESLAACLTSQLVQVPFTNTTPIMKMPLVSQEVEGKLSAS